MDRCKILECVHTVFVRYDLIGVIEKGFPEDEYQMEESKLVYYIEHNKECNLDDIYNELVIIICDWFGSDDLSSNLLRTLKDMSHEIYLGLDCG